MMFILWTLAGILALLVLAEMGARIYHRRAYLIPFRSKVIGEYPYRSFIEKVEPPLAYRFKKGFRSPMVTINRFRCRGPEPAPDGRKKRILLIGESPFFGVKLRSEQQLWSARLEARLAAGGYGDWEVLNAGNPTYNSYQHRLLWEQDLREIRPDILLVEIGGNDVSQAWMMGRRWQSGTPWPWKFIMALERKSPWWNHVLSRFCIYFLFRRRMTERKGFPRWDEAFQWDACLESIAGNYRAIVDDARRAGARVACLPYAPAFDPDPTPDQARSMAAIQANWKSFMEGRAEYDLRLFDFIRDTIAADLDLPFIDLDAAFRRHPRRYELYLDLAHFNAGGMDVVADTLYDALQNFGWLDRNEEMRNDR